MTVFADAVVRAADRLDVGPLETWILTRANEVDDIARLVAAEEAEVARQRRIGRYAPRNLTEPPGRKLRRKLVKDYSKAARLQDAVVDVLAFGWLAAAPQTDEGYRRHPPAALWNALTVHFISNDALDGVEWASNARAAAGDIWRDQLKQAELWPLRGRMRQKMVAGVYFGVGVMLHLLQRSEDISSPLVTHTAQWPMRDLPLLAGSA